jgi:pimeloyl-ACP methyl ester carboxylesterase
VFAIFHEPAQPAQDVAILMCPPFGWEDMCSYRARREWADALAGGGFAVLRIDLPGSGDSPGGPHDPERLRAWTEGADDAARWLSKETGARRIAAIGIGLGGAVVYNALAAGAPIDDLVLWGTSARGKTHLRELRAFSYMESPAGPGAQTPSNVQDTDDGSLSVAGYVLSEETQRELQELDLAALQAPRLGSAHVLLLERDGRPVDARLKGAIESHDAKLTVGEGDGYAAMMMAELPHSVSAHTVFDRVSEWLLEEIVATGAGAEGTPADGEQPRGETSTEISMPDGTRVRETPITIEHPLGNPIGILTEPVGPAVGLCAVWLNAGPQRRIGPNRMWVEAARRWAAQGGAELPGRPRRDRRRGRRLAQAARDRLLLHRRLSRPGAARARHAPGARSGATLHPRRAVRGGLLVAADRAGGRTGLGGRGAQPGLCRLRRGALQRDRAEP